MLSLVRQQIRVHGIVQGVGFRPFVYNLANRLGLTGYVLNSSAGVLIEVEGEPGQIHRFVSELNQNPPPLAQIEDIAVASLETGGCAGFVIRESVDEPGQLAPVSPDVATCAELPARCASRRRPPLRISLHQLHQLRPALHHHARDSL